MVPEHLFAITAMLREAGAQITTYDDTLTVEASGRPREMHLIETGPYPGFPTDMQAQMCTAASIARGTSIVVESVFDNRFKHVGELAWARTSSPRTTWRDQRRGKAHGAEVRTMDLRGGAALVLAGLYAEGTTIVDQAHIIDRGYQAFESELRMLGADIRRED